MTWKRMSVAMIAAFAVMTFIGCAEMPVVKGPSAPSCATNISYELAYQAELVKLDCTVKKYKGTESLFFMGELKNVADKPLRFRINFFLPNGKAVGGLLPRKGKPPVIKPGEIVKFKFPVKGYNEKPESLEVLVRTMK